MSLGAFFADIDDSVENADRLSTESSMGVLNNVKMVAIGFLPTQKTFILRAFASLTSSYRAHFLEF